jgi:aldose 1-epimerase
MKWVSRLSLVVVVVLAIGLVGATSPMSMPKKGGAKISISNPDYGTTPDGKTVVEYTLTNARGMEVKVITYGGIIESVKTQDQHGQWADVVLGLKSLSDYETESPYFGAIIGRYANRIGHGMFTLDGTTYCLDLNNQPNGGYWVSLHGGNKGFDKQVWEVTEAKAQGNEAVLQLHYLSPAGDGWTNTIPAESGFSVPNPYCPPGAVNGYPGNLDTYVTYTLNNQNQLVIDYKATTDADTVLNLTNHSYFNLGGESSGDIYGEMLQINGSQITPADQSLIPTGAFESVAGTPFDFLKAKAIGQDIRVNDPQLVLGPGFDHNWVLNAPSHGDKSMSSKGNKLTLAATLTDPGSGRVLRTWTTEPGLQFYAGNFLTGAFVGIGNHMYRQSDALTLETQHYPDSPNQPNFPSTELKAGQTFVSETIYAFSTH